MTDSKSVAANTVVTPVTHIEFSRGGDTITAVAHPTCGLDTRTTSRKFRTFLSRSDAAGLVDTLVHSVPEISEIVKRCGRQVLVISIVNEDKFTLYSDGIIQVTALPKVDDIVHELNDKSPLESDAPCATADIIAQRETTNGSFTERSAICQDLKRVMMNTDGWSGLSASQRESLEMIQHKISRILNGKPDYVDHWEDIAGYAQLVVNELKD